MNRDLLRVILLTVAYSDQFEYSLNFTEIVQRLILLGWTSKQIRNFDLTTFHRHVFYLLNLKLLASEHDQITLFGSETNFQTKEIRNQLAKAKWAEVTQVVSLLKKLPWIEAVFVTGALALDNTPENDDLDLLIITQPRRLWLSRLVVTWLAKKRGKRRSWHGEEANSWCFNMWLDSQHLSLPASHRNLFSAYELMQTRCVFDHSQMESKIFQQNRWVKTYLPLYYQARLSQVKSSPAQVFWGKHQWWLDVADLICYWGQLAYMLPHRTSEKIHRGFAFFHPRDTRALIMSRWQRSLLFLLMRKLKNDGQTIVLVTGVFDVLHQEHLRFLTKAKKQGDVLIVGLESDVRVRRLKGSNRPVNHQAVRVENLQQLGLADYVFILPEKFDSYRDHQNLISQIRPDVLAVSSHTAHLAAKKKIVEKHGGQLKVVHPHNPAISSSQYIQAKSL